MSGSWGVNFDADKALEIVQEAAAEGLEACRPVLKEESQKICPKDRGFNGGLVSTYEDEVDPEALTLLARYTADHAKRQQWDRKYKHKHGEQALYLLNPLTQNGPRFLGIVADKIRAALRR